jgi:hypothetical protein
VKRPPGLTGATGQSWVTAMAGVVNNGQVADVLLETTAEVQLSRPLAVTSAVTEQSSNGVVNFTVKLAVPPGARLASVWTVLGED